MGFLTNRLKSIGSQLANPKKAPVKKTTTTKKTASSVVRTSTPPVLSSGDGINWSALAAMKAAGLSDDTIRALDPARNSQTAPTAADDPIKQLTDLQFAPKRNQLNRNLETITQALQRDTDTQNRYGEIGDKRIQDIYASLGSQLQQLAAKTQQNFSGAQSQINQTYANALAGQKSAGNDAANSLQAAATALGLGAAAPDALSKLAALTAQQQGSTEASRAGALSNLQTLSAGQGGIDTQGIADSAREGAQQRTSLAQQIASAIAQAQVTANDSRSDIYGQLSDLSAEEGAAYVDNKRQAQLDKLAEEIQRRTIAIQEGQLGLSARELDARLNQSQDPYEILKQQADIERINSETALNRAKLTGGTDPTSTRYKGQQGVEQWLNTPSQYWGQAAGPKFRTELNNLIQESQVRAANTGIDPYQLAVSAVQSQAGAKGLNPDALFTALNIFFGKYATNS